MADRRTIDRCCGTTTARGVTSIWDEVRGGCNQGQLEPDEFESSVSLWEPDGACQYLAKPAALLPERFAGPFNSTLKNPILIFNPDLDPCVSFICLIYFSNIAQVDAPAWCSVAERPARRIGETSDSEENASGELMRSALVPALANLFTAAHNILVWAVSVHGGNVPTILCVGTCPGGKGDAVLE